MPRSLTVSGTRLRFVPPENRSHLLAMRMMGSMPSRFSASFKFLRPNQEEVEVATERSRQWGLRVLHSQLSHAADAACWYLVLARGTCLHRLAHW